jgi:ribosomal protein S18 acetylase RimI-like enzyme
MVIKTAVKEDLQEILNLQYSAYQSEAVLVSDPNIQPLTQTYKEIEEEFSKGKFLKAVDENTEIIGSVRAFSENGTLHIGKLMVRPDLQRKGIGTALLREIETLYPHKRYELFTSSKSESNIRLYEKAGYTIFKKVYVSDNLTFVYLEKTM